MQTVGIIGTGQLGRMLALSALNIGYKVIFLHLSEKLPEPPFATDNLGKIYLLDDYELFCAAADVITYETENVNLNILQKINQRKTLTPSIKAIEIAQDRIKEKNFYNALGLSGAKYLPIKNEEDVADASKKLGLPFIVKTATDGYDGKGQFFVKHKDDIAKISTIIDNSHAVAEEIINFCFEVSMIGVRTLHGSKYEICFYPLMKNTHKSGVLEQSEVLRENIKLQTKAELILKTLMEKLDYIGVFTVEFFVVKDKTGELALKINEIAPRVHNSGHITQDACYTSQFDNHIRAIVQAPLGTTKLKNNHAVMLNLLGSFDEGVLNEVLAVETTFLHLYNKSYKDKRKIGHINLVSDCAESLKAKQKHLSDLLGI